MGATCVSLDEMCGCFLFSFRRRLFFLHPPLTHGFKKMCVLSTGQWMRFCSEKKSKRKKRNRSGSIHKEWERWSAEMKTKKKERCTRGRNLRGDGAVSRATKKDDPDVRREKRRRGREGQKRGGDVEGRRRQHELGIVSIHFELVSVRRGVCVCVCVASPSLALFNPFTSFLGSPIPCAAVRLASPLGAFFYSSSPFTSGSFWCLRVCALFSVLSSLLSPRSKKKQREYKHVPPKKHNREDSP